MNRHVFASLLLGLLSSAAIAQESQQLSADELRARITGSTMEFKSKIDTPVRWTNNPNGTTRIRVTHDRGKGMSHDGLAPGTWSLSTDGTYCLTENWDVVHGGPQHWCAPVIVGSDGSMSLRHGQAMIEIHQ
ncbi:hypothetical protein ABH944_005606 [Caballeronia udeis]|uniref:Uncharacterized protein n=1 Tax=Caballeronia udeis TaxID=1232866 RepID=A0ABW8MQ03_9BURK